MNLFDLQATINLDSKDYENNLTQAEGKTENFASKLGNGLKTAAKIGGAAISAAATGIGALVTKSTQSYAEYEQLVGGVDTLFKGASKKVQEYAERAYAEAGMSANEYMETVTGFSASLIQSLGGDTQKAAEYANVALVDMSDNANKMGTDLESIKTAYAGFSKQNFTLLDNLKLGYGGTKSEMERLIQDASKLDKSVQANDMSFGNIVKAIHAVQDELGIAGATSDEAATTIEGSVGMMKGAWENLVTAMGRSDADLSSYVNNFVESVSTVAKNVAPVVGQALSGVGTLVQDLAPMIGEQLPALVTQLLPPLADAALQLIDGLIQGLNESAPALMTAAVDIINNLIDTGITLLPEFIDLAMTMIFTLAQGLVDALPDLIERLPEIITGIINYFTENLPTFLEQGFTILETLMYGLIEAIPLLVEHLPEIIDALINFFVQNFPTIISMGGQLIGELIVGLIGAIPDILRNLPRIISSLRTGFEKGSGELKKAGKYLLEGLWNGISDKIGWLKEKVGGVVDIIKGWFTGKDGFDEHSPSKWSKKVFDYVMQGGAEGLEEGTPDLLREAETVTDKVKNGFGKVDMSFSHGLKTGSASGFGGAVNNFGGINITVNASDYANGREFAEQMAERFSEMAEEERRAYA